MPCSVFISYSRRSSAAHARALGTRLGDAAFLDTSAIDDDEHFPQLLLDGILDASVVVIFATQVYSESRFCRLEMRLALAGGDAAGSHLVLALGEGWHTVFDALPPAITDRSWPGAEAAERLDALVQRKLGQALPAIRQRLSADEAQRLSKAFLEESKLDEPQRLDGILCSFPPGMADRSIGARFVGRADVLRDIHLVLSGGNGGVARLTVRIIGGAGFGKTRLAIEYVHRYGARYYPGGIFWVNAASRAIELEFWRVLSTLDPNVPDITVMRGQGRDVTRELERALRKIKLPALYVIDNIPEADPGADPLGIGDFCPAVGAVSILATSRQDPREENVRSIVADSLGRDSAILLLTDDMPGGAALSWADWGLIADWVGDLPIALDLLNRSLALGSISPRALLERVHSTDQASSVTGELDSLRGALRGQVTKDALPGVTEAFLISFEKLDRTTQLLAQLLAQLGPDPIPEAFMEALPDELIRPGARAALRSRHFITSGDDFSFGVMHRLMADFLRRVVGEAEPELLRQACTVLGHVITPDRCRDPRYWPLMRLCRPHAETLFARGYAMHNTITGWSEMGIAAAFVASAQGDHAGARRLEERVVEVMVNAQGEEHPDTLTAMQNLAQTLFAQGDHASASLLQERVLEVSTRVQGEEHHTTLTSMSALAERLRAQGDHAGARRLGERVLKVRMRVQGEEHPATLRSMNNLASTLSAQGDYTGARGLLERVVEVSTRVQGEEHPDTLTAMDNLASTLFAEGDHAGAFRLQERVVEVSTRVQGEEHPATLRSMNNLASTLSAQGDYTGARGLLERVVEVSTRVQGEEHPATQASMRNLASLQRQAESAMAFQEQEVTLEVMMERETTLRAKEYLARTLWQQGDHAGARRAQEELLKLMMRVRGEEHPDTLTSMNNLAAVLEAQGDYAGARRLEERVLEGRRRVLGEEHGDTLLSMTVLAATLEAQGDLEGALRLEERVVEVSTHFVGKNHPATLAAMSKVAALKARNDHSGTTKFHGKVLQAIRAGWGRITRAR